MAMRSEGKRFQEIRNRLDQVGKGKDECDVAVHYGPPLLKRLPISHTRGMCRHPNLDRVADLSPMAFRPLPRGRLARGTRIGTDALPSLSPHPAVLAHERLDKIRNRGR
jgi:hypothetical protein